MSSPRGGWYVCWPLGQGARSPLMLNSWGGRKDFDGGEGEVGDGGGGSIHDGGGFLQNSGALKQGLRFVGQASSFKNYEGVNLV